MTSLAFFMCSTILMPPRTDAEILKVQEESKKMNMRVTLEAASHSSVLENSKAQVVKPQSSDDAEQPELEFSKQSPTSVSGVLSHLNLGPRCINSLFLPAIESFYTSIVFNFLFVII